MADGTGLPLPKGGGVLAQAPGMVSGDSLHSAAAWNQIAASGEALAKDGANYLRYSEHKAQVGYLAGQDVAIQRKQIELRNQFANDPAGFDAAWTAYTEGTLTEAAPWAVNHVKAKLGSSGNSAYSAVLNETRVKAENNAKLSWNSLEDQSANDVTGAAMAGTLHTPEGQVAIEKYRGVVNTGVTSGFIPQAEADRRIANLESSAVVYGSRADVKSTFEASGPIAAANQIDNIVRNENLKLSPEQRLGLASRLRADVHAWDAERTHNLATVNLEANSMLEAKKGGVSIPQSRIDETVQRYKKFGGQAEAASFLANLQHADELSFLSRVPVSESAAWVDQYKTQRGFKTPQATPGQVGAINGVAGRLGILPRDLAAAISYETGGTFNPDIRGGKGGNYAGLIQFGPEERARYGVKPGMTFEEQMGAVENFLRDRGVKPGMGVAEIYRTINGGNPNAPLSASDGNGTIADHIGRIKSGHYGNADRFLGVKAADAPPSATPSDTAFLGKANALVSKRVTDEAAAVMESMKKDVLPTQTKIDELLSAAAATNNPDVLQQVSIAAGEYQFRRQFGRAPLPQEAGVVSALQQKATTEGLDQGDARRLEMATEIRERTEKRLADDPLAHTVSALSDNAGMPVPTPLNVQNPVAFQAGLRDRAKWAQVGTRTFETSPMPALTATEVTQVRAALDAADPAGKARIYSDIVTALPPGVRGATLEKLGTKGVAGMVEAFAGSMIAVDPAVGESIIRGQSAMKVKNTFNLTQSNNKDDATAALDKYLPSGAFSVAARTDPNGAYATMRGAVIARAADLAAADPNFKGDFTDEIIQRAASDVTGGIVEHNGAPVIAPIRGMTQQQFESRIWGLTDLDVAGVTTQSGAPITPQYIRDNAQLESLADGRYLVRLGRDYDRPIYAFRDVGAAVANRMRPFVLDLRNVTPDAQRGGQFDLSQALP